MRSRVGILKSKYGIKKQGVEKRLDWKSYATVVAGTLEKQFKASRRRVWSYRRKCSSRESWSSLAIWGKTKTGDKK